VINPLRSVVLCQLARLAVTWKIVPDGLAWNDQVTIDEWTPLC
jgi:hypothetical protein